MGILDAALFFDRPLYGVFCDQYGVQTRTQIHLPTIGLQGRPAALIFSQAGRPPHTSHDEKPIGQPGTDSRNTKAKQAPNQGRGHERSTAVACLPCQTEASASSAFGASSNGSCSACSRHACPSLCVCFDCAVRHTQPVQSSKFRVVVLVFLWFVVW